VRVVDASVIVKACLGAGGPDDIEAGLVAPPLLWSEALSAIHELRWRGEIDEETADLARARLAGLPVTMMAPDGLASEAWRVADELGWARTYDAEYVALARMLGRGLLTIDARLARGASRLIDVSGPAAAG
jgi:predicted nucleic acid-binding protein